jgi:hypothetical protein
LLKRYGVKALWVRVPHLPLNKKASLGRPFVVLGPELIAFSKIRPYPVTVITLPGSISMRTYPMTASRTCDQKMTFTRTREELLKRVVM